MFSSVPTFDFDLILGSFLSFWALMGFFDVGVGFKIYFAVSSYRLITFVLRVLLYFCFVMSFWVCGGWWWFPITGTVQVQVQAITRFIVFIEDIFKEKTVKLPLASRYMFLTILHKIFGPPADQNIYVQVWKGCHLLNNKTLHVFVNYINWFFFL